MASRSAKKGKGSFGAKPPKNNAMGGSNNYVTKAAGLKRGGAVGSSMPFGGPSAVKRLDRPGRKRGGAVGADSSPMTTAHNTSGGKGGSHDEDEEGDRAKYARGGNIVPAADRRIPPPKLDANMGGESVLPKSSPLPLRSRGLSMPRMGGIPSKARLRPKTRSKFPVQGPDLD